MQRITGAIYAIVGPRVYPPISKRDVNEHVEFVFKAMF